MNFYVVSFGYEFIHHQNIDARTKVNSRSYSSVVHEGLDRAAVKLLDLEKEKLIKLH